MRIIGGKYRSRVLKEFPGTEVRPTSDRAREALFNILSPKLYGARVLDLFCGTGALGLEALSRGAREAVFNDLSRDSVRLVGENIGKLGLGRDEAKVCNLDYSVCLDRLEGKFDIVFLDPPYRLDCGTEALKKLAGRGLLAEGGVAVLERDVLPDGEIPGLERFDERKYGKAKFAFYRPV